MGLGDRIGEHAELLADLVELVLVLGRLEQRPRVDLGDLLHGRSVPPLLSGERREVELAQRFLHELALVLLGERLARDLLRRQDRQAGHLLAQLADRALDRGLRVLARLLENLLARVPSLLDALALDGLSRLARAHDDLLRLPARLLEPLTVLVEQRVGLPARALRGL